MQTAATNTDRPGVLIVSQYQFPEHKRNMNMYQRVVYGAQHAQLHLLVRRMAEVSAEIRAAATVHRAPVQQRWLFLVYILWFCLVRRPARCRAILTEPSGMAAAGYLASRLAGMCWALDVWDRPRWRTGTHEAGRQAPLSDRVVFWLMRRADLYLLSVLPPAAHDIAPAPGRCVQLYNAIEMSCVAAHPPPAPAPGAPLELAYGRSQFFGTMGLQLVIAAAERLRQAGVHVRIHLIGNVPDEDRRALAASPAAGCFTVHGFTVAPRLELFKRIHVGLVPYQDFEDLKYILPIKVLEHLSQGNPVIVSRLPGLEFMVQHEYNGLAVEPGSAAELADAIARLARDRGLWERLAANALVSIRRFDAAQKNAHIFEAVLHAAGERTCKPTTAV